MDTRKFRGGTPVQTILHFFPQLFFTHHECPSLQLEPGMHRPSPEDSTAPFYPDPSQRIVALTVRDSCHFVLRLGALLKFLGSREGSEIQWEEWRNLVIIPSTNLKPRGITRIWVSGCKFFSLHSTGRGPAAHMETHDFSVWGRTDYIPEQVVAEHFGVRYMPPTGARGLVQEYYVFRARSGHDNTHSEKNNAVL